jgi:hypothetical protein
MGMFDELRNSAGPTAERRTSKTAAGVGPYLKHWLLGLSAPSISDFEI